MNTIPKLYEMSTSALEKRLKYHLERSRLFIQAGNLVDANMHISRSRVIMRQLRRAQSIEADRKFSKGDVCCEPGSGFTVVKPEPGKHAFQPRGLDAPTFMRQAGEPVSLVDVARSQWKGGEDASI